MEKNRWWQNWLKFFIKTVFTNLIYKTLKTIFKIFFSNDLTNFWCNKTKKCIRKFLQNRRDLRRELRREFFSLFIWICTIFDDRHHFIDMINEIVFSKTFFWYRFRYHQWWKIFLFKLNRICNFQRFYDENFGSFRSKMQ